MGIIQQVITSSPPDDAGIVRRWRESFAKLNGLDLADLSALEIETSWDYDEHMLMAYVRNHIREFC